MKLHNVRKAKVLGLLGLPLIAVAMLAVFFSMELSSSDSASAQVNATVDFSIGIDVDGDTADDCHSEGTTKCNSSEGSTVTVNLYLDSVGDKGPYDGFEILLNFSGMTSKANFTPFGPDNPATPEEEGPPCGNPVADYQPGEDFVGCAPGTSDVPSNYTGIVGSIDYNCTTGGSIAIIYGDGNTSLVTGTGSFTPSDPGEEGVDINCPTPTATSSPTPTPTPPPVPRMQKLDVDDKEPGLDPNGDNLSSIFLTRQGTKIPPARCVDGTDTTVFAETISIPIPLLPDPKDDTANQQLGAFEFEIMAKDDLVCIEILPGPAADGFICFVQDDVTDPTGENQVRIGCVTQGKDVFPDTTTEDGRHLADIVVRPQEELYSLLTPNQDNGVTVQLLNQNCELSDLQGHPIEIFSCEDADVTIRFLEGDVAGPDCLVNSLDTQAVAFRWGVTVGSLLYSQWYDLEPSNQFAHDGDVDIKDLQFVFGRFGSTCKDQHPPQPPVNPKA